VTSTYRIACIPGDGIGVEVTAAARGVLNRAANRHQFALARAEYDWSCERYLATGQMMPEDGIDELRQHDAVFLGAVGFPGVPDHVSLWGLLIPIRRSFDQYVNLRPVRLWPGVASPLAGRGPDDIDMVIVRENSEGEYSLIGGRHGTGAAEFAVQQSVFTRRGVERIARYAFGLAERRRGSVGVRPPSPTASSTRCRSGTRSWREWRPSSRGSRMNRCMPTPVVGSNLFGDILSDLAAAVAGSLGTAPSGNIDPSRGQPSMFESCTGRGSAAAWRWIASTTRGWQCTGADDPDTGREVEVPPIVLVEEVEALAADGPHLTGALQQRGDGRHLRPFVRVVRRRSSVLSGACWRVH